jgi:hypothetical protein
MKEQIEIMQKMARETRDAIGLIPDARLGLNLQIKCDGILDRLLEMQNLLIPIEGELAPAEPQIIVKIENHFAKLQLHLAELASGKGLPGGNPTICSIGLTMAHVMAARQEFAAISKLLS